MLNKHLLYFFGLLLTNINGEKPFSLYLERANLKYVDEGYLTNVSAQVTRANRTAPYVLNFQMFILKPWYDNITISSTSYEFKSNQYKKSFIETSSTVCSIISKDGEQFFIGLIRKFSKLPNKCPLPRGMFQLKDLILIEDYFPTGFPISKWRFNIIIKQVADNLSILKMDLFLRAETRLKRAKATNKHSKKN